MINKKNIKYLTQGAFAGSDMIYRSIKTPFGPAHIGVIQDRLVFFGFGPTAERELLQLKDKWKLNHIGCDQTIFSDRDLFQSPLPMTLIGTPFQQRVWQALQDIPAGQTKTYGELADILDSAPRAIGGGVGRNPISYFVPCHRVIAQAGGLGGYRWGLAIKQKILATETR